MFFVLSGFLITSILITSRDRGNYYSSFFIRRAARILPMYAMLLAVFFVGRASHPSSELFGGEFNTWTYAAFLQNIEMSRRNTYGPVFLNPTWSLAIEEQFYLVFPFVVALARSDRLPKILIAIIIVAPLLRIGAYAGFGYLPAYMLTPARADSLAVGALTAWATIHARPWLADNRRWLQVACLAAIAIVPIVWLVPRSTEKWHAAVWGHTYFTLLYGATLLLVLLNAGAMALWPLRTRMAAGVAAISYTLYLVHLPVLIAVYATFGATQNLHSASGVMLVALALALSLMLSWVSYVVIERPILRSARGHSTTGT